MDFLKRRRTSATGPAWAPSLSAEEATAFLAQVDRAADTIMESLVGPPRELAYGEARELLKVPLWDSQVVKEAGLYRDVAEGLGAVVCVDLPETIEATATDDVTRWGVPGDKLFEIAVDNVRSQVEVDVSDHDLGEGVVVRVAEGESFFSATLALRPADLGVQIGEHGALVAVPRCDTALVCPIRDAQRHVAAARKLLTLTGGLYDGVRGALNGTSTGGTRVS